jgi:hypothetical protein
MEFVLLVELVQKVNSKINNTLININKNSFDFTGYGALGNI